MRLLQSNSGRKNFSYRISVLQWFQHVPVGISRPLPLERRNRSSRVAVSAHSTALAGALGVKGIGVLQLSPGSQRSLLKAATDLSFLDGFGLLHLLHPPAPRQLGGLSAAA